VQDRESIDRALNELFDAERTVRRLHDSLADDADKAVLLDALCEAVPAAERDPRDDEACAKLVRIAALLGELEGPRPVDALIDVLASERPEARSIAGEQLEQIAYERFKEVARGVERALKRLPVGSPALAELPYVIAEVPEPGVGKLLGQFLQHQDPDAVAAGIEAIAEIGETSAIPQLEKLSEDPRTVEIAGDGDRTDEVTLGELAEEAIGLLKELEAGRGDDDDEDGAGSA